uniref:uncharacterized protein LOC130474504 n=1 Tax=Euleptes europaea TaxID=460621 RepID=UPI00254250F9|nr:uncharacterized protein LOC130474504 [Euleptes europaea]
MAAAPRTKRKMQLPKRRKQAGIKKTQRRKLLPKLRKPQMKRGKSQPKRGKPQPKRGNLPVPPKPVLKRTYDQLISKVLRQLNRDKVYISTKTKGKMISFIRKFYNNMAEQAKRGKKFKHLSTIGSNELQNALKRVMPKDEAMVLAGTIRKVSRVCRR